MILYYSLCQLLKNRLRSFITVLGAAIGFIIIVYAGETYIRCRESEWKSKNVIQGSCDNIYHMNMINYTVADENEQRLIYELYQWIKTRPEVKWCGFYYYEHMENNIYVAGNILQMTGINADVGEKVSKGDNSYFPDENYMNGEAILIDLSEYNILDLEEEIKEVPVLLLNGVLNNLYFEVKDGCVDFPDRVKNKAIELGLDIYGINSLQEQFEQNEKLAMENSGQKYVMPFVMILCVCVSFCICTMQSYEINKRDSAIMLACGMTRYKVAGIYAGEVFLKFLAGYGLCLMYWIFKIRQQRAYASFIYEYKYEYGLWFNRHLMMLLICCGICFVLTFVCSLPIIRKIKKTDLSLGIKQ